MAKKVQFFKSISTWPFWLKTLLPVHRSIAKELVFQYKEVRIQ